MIIKSDDDTVFSYRALIEDISTRVAEKIFELQKQPEVISQREAYKQYGRANVERWTRQNKLHPCKRPGKVEYKTAELRKAQQINQDYF